MTTRRDTELQPTSEWKALTFNRTSTGYSVTEATCAMGLQGFRTTLRFAGVAMIVAGSLSWLMAPLGSADELLLRGAAAALVVGIGLAVFMCVAAGGRRALHVDTRDGELRMVKVSAAGRETVCAAIPTADVETLYVRRADQGGGLAMLMVRSADSGVELCALRGPAGEMTALQRKLARDFNAIRSADDSKIIELPRRQVTPRRVQGRGGRLSAANG